ncbi:MAG: heat-inducible transcriptional repressor HrcA [Robiginitomaculum sp.]|nr:heat-inducible transcriptional repressor HrcA [Robiginitomaculum sp.]MDQ7076881.1 heat-inducible transcriptional repressor HrcA [Robiginitomaculum sp.]
MNTTPSNPLSALDARSREIFRELVESYLQDGEPVGSRKLAQNGKTGLSSASIRNTLADLAAMGLLTSPHVSAGRLPTQAGLRLFVDGLLQIGDLVENEQRDIDARVRAKGATLDQALTEASSLLSGLAGGAGLVLAPVHESALRHVEFVPISSVQTLAVLVYEDGSVENRLMSPPPGATPAALSEAGNYLSARLKGRTLDEARKDILEDIANHTSALDEAAEGLITKGLADWAGGPPTERTLIVRGRSNLLGAVEADIDLERIRYLFDDLERKKEMVSLLDQAQNAPGVKIFIGSENALFSLSGSSVIVAPYMDSERRIIGALGVIGPTRINYARVIPMVDYTARAVGHVLDRLTGK